MTVQMHCKRCGKLMEFEVELEAMRMVKLMRTCGVQCNECLPEYTKPSPKLPERIGKECATGETLL